MPERSREDLPDADLIGFFDEHGKWATVAGMERKLGDEFETPIRELLESLADIDMMRVRRNDDGEIVTAQLSEFARDLYELPEDADIGRVVGVYKQHGHEIPEELKDEYWEQFPQRVRGGSDA